MSTIQKEIVTKFLASLSAAKMLEEEKIEQLRVLLTSGKTLKTEELVKLFAEPSGGDVK
jgi:hypothetical protein